MAEYIEREALMAQLEERKEYLFKKNGDYDHYSNGFDEAVDKVEDFPAADVVKVRRERWDENGRCTGCGGHAPYWSMASTYYKSPFCFECGADMRERRDNDATD